MDGVLGRLIPTIELSSMNLDILLFNDAKTDFVGGAFLDFFFISITSNNGWFYKIGQICILFSQELVLMQ